MTADQDMPNSVGQEAAFWAQQRTLAHGAERPDDEIKPRRIGWLIWPLLLVGALFSLWLLKQASAAEPRKQPVYVIWNETINEQAHAHQFSSPTACNTDIGGVAKTTPDGSRLSCRRIDSNKSN